MPDHFDSTASNTIDRDNRLMAGAGIAMSQTLNDLYAQIASGNIGITADAKDVDSLALGGGAFGYDPGTTNGLNFGLRSGRVWVGQTVKAVAASVTLLAASQTNYVEMDASGAGAISSNTAGFTTGRIPLYIVVTGVSAIATITNVKTILRAAVSGTVTGLLLSTPAATKEVVKELGTISATASFPITGVGAVAALAKAVFNGSAAIAQSDTDYWSFALVNAAAVQLLDTGNVNTTKVTGGSALAANVPRVLTKHATNSLATVVDDGLILTITKTVVPANLTAASIRLDFSFVG